MDSNDLIGRVALAGVCLSVDGPNLVVEPRSAITGELRTLIRENKLHLMEALAPAARGVELRRQRVLAELARHPQAQRWAIFDPDAESERVICTVATRNVGTCELHIPRDKYDPWLVLQALQTTQ